MTVVQANVVKPVGDALADSSTSICNCGPLRIVSATPVARFRLLPQGNESTGRVLSLPAGVSAAPSELPVMGATATEEEW